MNVANGINANTTFRRLRYALFDDDTKLTFSEQQARDKYEMLKIAPKADLRDADLSDADLSDADLSGADLSGANLSGANLQKTNLKDAQLDGATLTNAVYDDSTKLPFSDKEAKEKTMWKLEKKADLQGVNLREVDLSNIDLTGAKLQYANLNNVRFDQDPRSLKLTNVKLTNAQYNQCTNLPFSQEKAKEIEMIYVPYVSPTEDKETCFETQEEFQKLREDQKFDQANKLLEHRPVDWSNNNYEKADLSFTDLTGANLSSIILKDANLENTILTRCRSN